MKHFPAPVLSGILVACALVCGLLLFSTCNNKSHESGKSWTEIFQKPKKVFTPDSILCAKLKRALPSKDKEIDQMYYINYSISSKEKRFFVLDLPNCKIIQSGLVCSGNTDENGKAIFSNIPNSHQSSEGLMKIGNKYHGQFGLAYKLHGLEEQNSKVFERYIVLHAHDCVPDEEVDYHICISQGCPTVSPNFLKNLSKLIDEEDVQYLYIE